MDTSSFEGIITLFIERVSQQNRNKSNVPLVDVMTSVYQNEPQLDTISFDLDDDSTTKAIDQLREKIINNYKLHSALKEPISYLLDELTCNIQQHAKTDKGYAYLMYNSQTDTIDILIADYGITIYGSYVVTQKHLDKLGESDAEALNLAQNGYSTKDLPEAENRGYGISSNIKMVVTGLHGEFAALSGNALLIYLANRREILSLPTEIDFKGTMIVVRIPAHVPDDFNIYNYIN